MGTVKAIGLGLECLAGALLLLAAYLNYRYTCGRIEQDRQLGDWMVHFHERIWEFESDDGHGGATTDHPEG